MTTPTTNMSLLKAQDADNAETYLVTSLGGSLDTVDAHAHGPTDASGLAVKRVQSGLDAAKPTAGHAGVIYVATDTKRIYFDDGSALDFTFADPTTTRGDIITRGASAIQRVGLGTSGQALVSNGTDVVWGSASKTLLFGNYNGANIALSHTTYLPFGQEDTSIHDTESGTQIPILAGTVKNFRLTTLSTQNAGGTMVFTVRKNAVDTAIVITVTAGGGAADWSDLSDTVSFSAGDKISIKAVNNYGGGASATIGGYSLELDAS